MNAKMRWQQVSDRRKSIVSEKEMHAKIKEATENLRVLLNETQSKDTDSGLQRMFSLYDKGNKGYLTNDEFAQALKDHDVTNEEELAQALYMRFDDDGSGTLEFEEFVQVLEETVGASAEADEQEVEKISAQLKNLMQQKTKAQSLKNLFERIDSEGNGLNMDEFAQVLREMGLGEGAKPADFKALFSLFDLDGSGQIDLDELTKTLPQIVTNNRSSTKADSATLVQAKKKEADMEKRAEQRRLQEQKFKERRNKLESAITEGRAQAANKSCDGELRMAALQKVQEALEEIEALKEEEAEALKEYNASEITMTMQETAALRGLKAMEQMKKQLNSSNTFRKAVSQANHSATNTKSPTVAEVKAKKKYMEETAKAIDTEEKAIKKRIETVSSEMNQAKDLMNSPTTPAGERLAMADKCYKLAEILEESETELATKQEEWKHTRETLKFTAEEDRVWRGVQAMNKARLARKSSEGGDALHRLKRAQTLRKKTNSGDEKKVTEQRVKELQEELAELDRKIGELTDTHDEEQLEKRTTLQTQRNALSCSLDAAIEHLKNLKERKPSNSDALAVPTTGRKRSTGSASGQPDPSILDDVREATQILHDKVHGQGGMDEMKLLFQKYDTTGQGELTKEEFIAALQDLDVSQNEDILEALFTRFDADGSGTVEFDEFIADVPASDKENQTREVDKIVSNLREVMSKKRGLLALKKLFEQYDTDGSGTLDADEFAATLQDLGIGKGASVADMKMVFQKFDADGSGSLELAEFTQAMSSNNKEAQKKEREKLQRAKEKTKLLEGLSKDKMKDEANMKKRKSETQMELDAATERAKSDKESAMDRIANYERCVELNTKLEEIHQEETGFEAKWAAKEKEYQLNEEEVRLIRGLKAMVGLRDKLTEPKAAPRPKPSAPTRAPTHAEVKARLIAYEKLEATYLLNEAVLEKVIKELNNEMDAKRSAMRDEGMGGMDRLNSANEAYALTELKSKAEEELEEVKSVWEEKKVLAELDRSEQSVLRGLQAMELSRKGRGPGPALVRKAKAKTQVKEKEERALEQEQRAAEEALGSARHLVEAVPIVLRVKKGEAEPEDRAEDEVFQELKGKGAIEINDRLQEAKETIDSSKSGLKYIVTKLKVMRGYAFLTTEESEAIKSIRQSKTRDDEIRSSLNSSVLGARGRRNTRIKTVGQALKLCRGAAEAAGARWSFSRRSSSASNVGGLSNSLFIRHDSNNSMVGGQSGQFSQSMLDARGESLSVDRRMSYDQGSERSQSLLPDAPSDMEQLVALQQEAPKSKYDFVRSVVAAHQSHRLPQLRMKEVILAGKKDRLGGLSEGCRKEEDQAADTKAAPRSPLKSPRKGGGQSVHLPSLSKDWNSMDAVSRTAFNLASSNFLEMFGENDEHKSIFDTVPKPPPGKAKGGAPRRRRQPHTART